MLPAPAKAELESYPVARLKSLDKITARTQRFDVRVGQTIQYGPLLITVRTCRKAPPIEPPRTAAFLEIIEQTEEGGEKWIFSGWMFASSPALSSMDHPVYDVWVLDCLKLENADLQNEDTDTEQEGPEDEQSGQPPEDTEGTEVKTDENTDVGPGEDPETDTGDVESGGPDNIPGSEQPPPATESGESEEPPPPQNDGPQNNAAEDEAPEDDFNVDDLFDEPL